MGKWAKGTDLRQSTSDWTADCPMGDNIVTGRSKQTATVLEVFKWARIYLPTSLASATVGDKYKAEKRNKSCAVEDLLMATVASGR